MKNNLPLGIKIIYVLGYILFLFTLIIGLLSVLGVFFLPFVISQNIPLIGVLLNLGQAVFLYIATISLCIAVLSYFTSRGLSHGKNWARLFTIVSLSLHTILTIIFGEIGLVLIIFIAIVLYLLFNKTVRELFLNQDNNSNQMKLSVFFLLIFIALEVLVYVGSSGKISENSNVLKTVKPSVVSSQATAEEIGRIETVFETKVRSVYNYNDYRFYKAKIEKATESSKKFTAFYISPATDYTSPKRRLIQLNGTLFPDGVSPTLWWQVFPDKVNSFEDDTIAEQYANNLIK